MFDTDPSSQKDADQESGYYGRNERIHLHRNITEQNVNKLSRKIDADSHRDTDYHLDADPVLIYLMLICRSRS